LNPSLYIDYLEIGDIILAVCVQTSKAREGGGGDSVFAGANTKKLLLRSDSAISSPVLPNYVSNRPRNVRQQSALTASKIEQVVNTFIE